MNNIQNLKNFDVKKIPPKFFDGLAQLFYQLGINGHDVVEGFIYSYIKHAYQQSPVKSDMYAATGLGRGHLKKYLQQISLKPANSSTLSYKSLIVELSKLAQKTTDGIFPVYGKFKSFSSVYEYTKSGENITTLKSMLKKMIRMSHIHN